jgi:hypothetical protein
MMLKIVVVAAIPSASDNIALIPKPGVRARLRSPKRTSCPNWPNNNVRFTGSDLALLFTISEHGPSQEPRET